MSLVSDLRTLATSSGFRKLLGVRLVSQVGDGMFQAGLASLFFFSPQSMTSAPGVASALVVMFLPYSIVGPFTGPLLDRWRRRQVLLYGNLIRCVSVLAIALLMGVGASIAPVYVLVLTTLGLARFMLSGLSAGLPRVVGSKERLLMANSIVPTLGGFATGIGAILGFVMRLVLPAGASQETASLVIAAFLYLGAAGVASLLGADQLGPDRSQMQAGEPGGAAASLGKTTRDLREAASYLVRRATPALALTTMALHRFVYYVQLIVIILVSRNLLASPSNADAGLGYFGTLGGAMIAGHFLAVILTPIAHEHMEPWQWIVVCLIGGSVGQAMLVATPSLPVMIAGLFVFGIGVQGAKIAVDTIVQADTADSYRGRAFAIYDVMFNLAACAAAGIAIAVLPTIGWSRAVQTALFLFVWALASVFAYSFTRAVRKVRQDM